MAEKKTSITIDKIIGSLFIDEKPTEPLHGLDPYNRNILSSIIAGDYIGGDTTIIFSGPPKLSMAIKHKKLLYGLDHVGSISFNQTRINIPVSEFGEDKERYVSGKTRVQASLDKITTSKEDIKYALYKWMIDTSIERENYNMIFSKSPGHNAGDFGVGAAGFDSLKEYKHFPILSSELFNIPFGLFVVYMSKLNKIVYSMYIENCKINNSSQAVTSNPYIQEGVGLNVSEFKPALNLFATAKQKIPYTLRAPFTDPNPKPIEPTTIS